MVTVRYFFIHRGTTFMYLQYSRPRIYHIFQMFGRRRTPSVRRFCWCSILTALQHGIVHVLYCTRFLAVVLWLWRRDRNCMNSYRVRTVDVPQPPIAGGVILCTVMKNNGVLYHEVSWFSPEHWKKVVLQEPAVVGRVYCLPWRYSVVQYYPINVNTPQWTSASQHIV